MWLRAAQYNFVSRVRSADSGLWSHDLEEIYRNLIFWKECLFSEADFAFLRLDEIMCQFLMQKH